MNRIRIRPRFVFLGVIGLATIALAIMLRNQDQSTVSICQTKHGRHVFITPINTNPQKPETSTVNAGNLLAQNPPRDIDIQFCALPNTQVLGVFVTGKTSGFNQAEAADVLKRLKPLDGKGRIITTF